MTAKPPETAEWLLLFLLPDKVSDNVSGDLSEIFSAIIVPSRGIFRARLWYWRQVVCSLRLFLRFRNNPQNALELWKGRIYMNRPVTDAVTYHSGISMHHIPVRGAVGLLFTFATVFIFGVGIRAVREIFIVTGAFGILGSGILLHWHIRHPHKMQTLDLHKQKQN
jgi:hypothetical protein